MTLPRSIFQLDIGTKILLALQFLMGKRNIILRDCDRKLLASPVVAASAVRGRIKQLFLRRWNRLAAADGITTRPRLTIPTSAASCCYEVFHVANIAFKFWQLRLQLQRYKKVRLHPQVRLVAAYKMVLSPLLYLHQTESSSCRLGSRDLFALSELSCRALFELTV